MNEESPLYKIFELLGEVAEMMEKSDIHSFDLNTRGFKFTGKKKGR